MRRLGAAALLVAAIGVAVPARAETPATSEQIAQARAAADRVIAAAQAADVFENVTKSAVAEMRHRASGLVCGFDADDTGASIHVYSAGQIPRGDDVSCSHKIAGALLTVYATRYPKPMTTHDVLQESVNAMHQRFTDIAFWSGEAVTMKPDAKAGQPAAVIPDTVRIAAKFDGKPVFTRSSAALCGPWMIAHRTTVPAADATAADLAAEVELRVAIDEVCGAAAAR